jgi:hypothetical protein
LVLLICLLDLDTYYLYSKELRHLSIVTRKMRPKTAQKSIHRYLSFTLYNLSKYELDLSNTPKDNILTSLVYNVRCMELLGQIL